MRPLQPSSASHPKPSVVFPNVFASLQPKTGCGLGGRGRYLKAGGRRNPPVHPHFYPVHHEAAADSLGSIEGAALMT